MTKTKPFRHLAHVDSIQSSPITFFTVVIFGRRYLLNNETAHSTIRGIWERSAERNGWFVGDYILMPDHVHLFAQPGTEADPMQIWIQMWKSVSARVLVKTLPAQAPFWQEEYFDRFLRSAESYALKWEYVRNNPVRAGLVVHPEDWLYHGQICRLSF